MENEVRILANQLDKTGDEEYSNKMYIDKDAAREEKTQERHELEQLQFKIMQNNGIVKL